MPTTSRLGISRPLLANDQARSGARPLQRTGCTGCLLGTVKQFLSNSSGLISNLVGGWEFSPTFILQSGLPFTLSYGNCSAVIPGDAPCYPNGDPSKLTHNLTGTPGQGNVSFFTAPGIGADGFTAPGLDQIGNIKRNSVFGPRFFNSDMSLFKNISFRERYEAQFRVDAYNAFNHINLGNPNGSIDNGGAIGGGPFPAGIGGTTNPRQLQFTVHLQF